MSPPPHACLSREITQPTQTHTLSQPLFPLQDRRKLRISARQNEAWEDGGKLKKMGSQCQAKG